MSLIVSDGEYWNEAEAMYKDLEALESAFSGLLQAMGHVVECGFENANSNTAKNFATLREQTAYVAGELPQLGQEIKDTIKRYIEKVDEADGDLYL